MKYIDKIKQMSVDELAKSLKTFTDLLIENAISQLAERQGTHIDLKCFKDFTNIEDFKYCLESEVTMPMNELSENDTLIIDGKEYKEYPIKKEAEG